jgi:uncharacterized protein YggU (UPF0235/DUF167 family)
MALLAVKVNPRASRDAIGDWVDDTLRISVTAVPEKGKANAAVIELLARALRQPRSSLRVVRGDSQPNKLIEVPGLSLAELHAALHKPPR